MAGDGRVWITGWKARHLDVNLISGVVFTIVGVAAVAIAQDYRMGSLTRMGPGYFPTMLGVALALLGAGLVLAWALARTPDCSERLHLKSPLIIALAVVVFAVSLRPLGLFIAAFLTVVLASVAERNLRWPGVILLSLGLASFTSFLFVFALGLRIPVWPQW